MTEPISPENPDSRRTKSGGESRGASGPVPPQPRFRLVGDDTAKTPSRPGTSVGQDRPWDAVSPRLLVSREEWERHWPETLEGHVRVRASVPLIASLARIRSESDAALALTMVIETLFKNAQIQLPCGALEEAEIGFFVPNDAVFAELATAIDESLEGQVRATDLQGPLRARSKARVETF